MIDLVPDERTTCGVDPANLGTEEAVYSKRSESDLVMSQGGCRKTRCRTVFRISK